MTLDTMAPNPVWNASDHLKTVTTLSKLDASFVFKIWCDDGCKDCRAQLPDFSAALSAANINPNCIEQYSKSVTRWKKTRTFGRRIWYQSHSNNHFRTKNRRLFFLSFLSRNRPICRICRAICCRLPF